MAAKILIGTSGWMYKDWGEKFYPPDMKNPEKLAYISKHYATLEVNTSFYHFVRESTFAKWHEETSQKFVMSVKAPRQYTHFKKLKIEGETADSMRYFFKSVQPLKKKLGAVLFQLPGSFHADNERLGTFLDTLETCLKELQYRPDIAMEFRHESWFDQPTYDLLEKHNVALTIANSSRYPYEIRTTADFSYMRFHGPEQMFLGKYSDEELERWRDEILKFSKKLRKVYVYFNNDLEANAVENADTLVELFEKSSPKAAHLR